MTNGKPTGGRPRSPETQERRERAAILRSEGHTVAAIAAALGVSETMVHRYLKTCPPPTVAEPGPNSPEALRAVRISLTREQHRKTKTHNDITAGRLVWKDNVNALILRHSQLFNAALQQLRNIDSLHGTASAALLLEIYSDFGSDVETILNRDPKGSAAHA